MIMSLLNIRTLALLEDCGDKASDVSCRLPSQGDAKEVSFHIRTYVHLSIMYIFVSLHLYSYIHVLCVHLYMYTCL